MIESIPATLFLSLDIVVLESLYDGSFKLLTELPEWLPYADLLVSSDELMLRERSPFLDDFLDVAEDFWAVGKRGKLTSDPWIELTHSGKEIHLEASAICIETQRLLLIRSVEKEFEERQRILQKARTVNLAYESLSKEVNNNQVLIQCIAHDMTEPLKELDVFLTGINSNKLGPNELQLLQRGKRKIRRLRELIQEMTNAFAVKK